MLFRYRQLAVLHQILRTHGADADAVFRGAGFDPALVKEPSIDTEVDRLEALHRDAAAATGGRAIGLEVALTLEKGRFGWIEFAMRSARTLDESLGLLDRYAALINPSVTFAYAVQGDLGVLEQHVPRAEGLGPHVNEFALGYCLRAFREVTGQEWAPVRASFKHPTPTNLPAIEAHFRCPLTFGAPASGLVVSAEIRKLPLVTADDPLHRLLLQRLAELLPSATSPRPWATRVEGALLARLGKADTSIEAIARSLATSPRSLQRALADENTTFAEVADHVRRVLVDELLGRPDLPIDEIAVLAGYADVRALDRAYKRWTGTTPRASRRAKGPRLT
jgi:AraC-like DNA-binding protein